MTAIQNRYEFVYLFDVANGNPNGDPDSGNMPRIETESQKGLVTDVSLKRKVRNYVAMRDLPKCSIIIREREPLNPKFAAAFEAMNLPTHKKASGGWDKEKAKNRPAAEVRTAQQYLCKNFFDVRTFGAVMSTGPNAGQIRGPVQITFGMSIDPILPQELTITRLADVDKEEGEMGRKHIVPYGLYRAHGFISANFAERTGFSDDDLALFWEALCNMLDHDRSAARGEMNARRLIVFKHATRLGNAPAHKLFDAVAVKAKADVKVPRKFGDYDVSIDRAAIPGGVELIERI